MENGTGTGMYQVLVTDLMPNTTYYVKAYVIQNGAVYYGNSVTCSTFSSKTSLTTSAVSNIGPASATFNAIITDEGNPAYTERGILL